MNNNGEPRLSFKERYLTAKNITYFAILLALVIVLQFFGSSFKVGATQLNFVLVPIVLCGMILGAFPAGILGLITGLIIYFQGLFGTDLFTSILISDHPLITLLVCTIKGFFSGYLAGAVYRVIKTKNKTVASFIAGATCPIVNTALFILGALFMSDTIGNNFTKNSETVIYYLIIGCAGVNFLIELAINLCLAPATLKITEIIEKTIKG